MELGKVGVIVAARTSSTRLPGKALLPLQRMPMILFLLRRLRPLHGASVILGTTELPADDELAAQVEANGIPVFRGADADLVARYVAAAERFGFDTVVRVTGDCPFVDAELVEWCLRGTTGLERFDLVTTKGRFPVGLDVEIYHAGRMSALHESGTLTPSEREHLTLYFYDHRSDFEIHAIEPPADWAPTDRLFTVDTRADYEMVARLAAQFDRPDFSLRELLTKVAV